MALLTLFWGISTPEVLSLFPRNLAELLPTAEQRPWTHTSRGPGMKCVVRQSHSSRNQSLEMMAAVPRQLSSSLVHSPPINYRVAGLPDRVPLHRSNFSQVTAKRNNPQHPRLAAPCTSVLPQCEVNLSCDAELQTPCRFSYLDGHDSNKFV